MGKSRIWKGILSSLVAVGLVLGSVAPTVTADPRDIPLPVVEWAETQVMHVNADNGGVGSGFWVDNEYFVTACHVVGATYASFYFDEKTESFGWKTYFEVEPEAQVSNSDLSVVLNLKVLTCNTEFDIAVLKRQHLVSDTEFTANKVRYAHPNPRMGQTVYGTGYGLSERLNITVGHWQKQQRYGGKHDFIITSPTIFGDSGSPAVMYEDGEVILVGIRQTVRNGGGHPITHLAGVSDAMAIHMQVELAKEL